MHTVAPVCVAVQLYFYVLLYEIKYNLFCGFYKKVLAFF